MLADLERAKKHISHTWLQNQDSDDEESEPVEQPAWCELIQPNEVYDDYAIEFKYDDGGPEYDWHQHTYHYPHDFGKEWHKHTTLSRVIDPGHF